MPTLHIVSIGQTGCQWYIDDLSYLWDTNQYYQAYITITNVGTSVPVYAPSPPGSGYSTSWGNFSGLSPGQTYTAVGYIVTSDANHTTYLVDNVQFTTQAPSGNVPTGTLTLNAPRDGLNPLKFNLSWNAVSGTGTTYYEVAKKRSIDSTWTVVTSGITSTSYSITVDQYSTNYDFRVQSYNSYGNGSVGFSYNNPSGAPNTPPPSSPPSNLSATMPIYNSSSNNYSTTVSWTGVSDATYYEVHASYGGNPDVNKGTTSGTSMTITLDYAQTSYTIKVWSGNASGLSSTYSSITVTTGSQGNLPPSQSGTPVTPPAGNSSVPSVEPPINIIKYNSDPNDRRYYVSFNGTGTSNYRILARKSVDSQWYEKYNGPYATPLLNFDSNGTYYIRVYACSSSTDNSTCSMPTETSFTIGSTRPANWEWYTPKIQGANFSLSAAEWNDFTSRINAFRDYQGLATISFTTAPYGDGKVYAFMFNQALVGIRGGVLGGTSYSELNRDTSIALPSSVNSGEAIYAWYFNNMRDALNSVV
jgi:hypothetical protein